MIIITFPKISELLKDHATTKLYHCVLLLLFNHMLGIRY